MFIQQLTKFQQIVRSKRGAARRYMRKGVKGRDVGKASKKGLQRTVRPIKENSIFSPVGTSDHQFVFRASQRMERVSDPEPTGGVIGTTCS